MENELIFDEDKIKEANQDNEWVRALMSGEVKKKRENVHQTVKRENEVSLNQLRAIRR